MSDYRIHVRRSDDPDAQDQPFYVTVSAANGEVIFTSERYTNRLHAISVGEEAAAAYDGNLIDET